MRIVQLAHGKILPSYTSAYSLRCHDYIKLFEDRSLFSVSGLVFKDEISGYARQYRSLLTFAYSVFKKNRSFEYFLSKGRLLRKKYIREAARAIGESEIIVFEGPWQFYLFEEFLNDKNVVYDAHNVETNLRAGNIYEDYTRKLERALLSRADLVITVTEADSEDFASSFNIGKEKLVCIPEGFRHEDSQWMGLQSNNVVFVGSAYVPNMEAAKEIISFARELPDFNFLILGSVCRVLNKRKVPPNVKLIGEVSDDRKNSIISESFVALNPVTIGSGRNLKMNDYISHGVPIITTEIGARGFAAELKNLFVITGIEGFVDRIRWVSSNRDESQKISGLFLKYAKAHDYKETETKTMEVLSGLIAARQ